MYPPPSPSLSDATAKELDDQFFTSDPFAYIRSRILALLSDDRPAFEGSAAEEFARLLGPSSVHYTHCDDRTVKLQIAVDAFALRHQVAETLLRLIHVALHHQDGRSHWVELVDTPTRTIDVIKENRSALDAQEDGGVELLRAALVSPENTLRIDLEPRHVANSGPGRGSEPEEGSSTELIDRALDVHIGWINYAIRLFVQKDPDLDAAHNKFKHGMGLRPQDDVLSTITLTPPNSDGSVPLSSLTGDQAVNLFDGITTEFLSRASRKHGLETTQIAMLPAPTLVEAAAMAHTLALLFQRAAVKHFANHEPHEGRSIPAHPGLLVEGPRPGTLRPTRPFALRLPLTMPLRANSGPEALLFWTNGHVNTMVFGERIRGVVVDDPHDRSPHNRPQVD